MKEVILIALLVGGATILGSVLGFIFKNISKKFTNIILSFSAGIMLCSAVLGLIVPSYEMGGDYGIFITVSGVILGAVCLDLLERVLSKREGNLEKNEKSSRGVLLFAMAIAIHNLPEGLASGVSLGLGNFKEAMLISGGIALQNVPEGMATISPMINAGFSRKKALAFSVFTGIIEIGGVFIGYLLLGIARGILPFALAFAGGTMLYVINDEIIPEAMCSKASTYALLCGFLVMLVFEAVL